MYAFSISFVILGVVLALYHSSIGELSTKFREKWWNVTYSNEVRNYNKLGFLVVGFFFIILGTLLMFGKIS